MPALPPPGPGCDSCASRDQQLAGQAELIAELRGALGEQAGQIAELKKKLARLERLATRNSGNSPVPPPADDQPGKKPPEPKGKRQHGRKPGKQKGAPGACLAWSEHPDDTPGHFPAGPCACGADLAAAADLGVKYSHQG